MEVKYHNKVLFPTKKTNFFIFIFFNHKNYTDISTICGKQHTCKTNYKFISGLRTLAV